MLKTLFFAILVFNFLGGESQTPCSLGRYSITPISPGKFAPHPWKTTNKWALQINLPGASSGFRYATGKEHMKHKAGKVT